MKAFKDGKVVDEFIGALPPAQVERFLDRIVPSEADALVASGTEADLRRALELEPGRADASLALAGCWSPPAIARARWSCSRTSPGRSPPTVSPRGLRLADDPDLAPAFAALDEGLTEQGLDALIAAMPGSRRRAQGRLRQVVVGVLDELGPAHPLARDARRKLASALY